MSKGPQNTFDPTFIRNVSEFVYRARLESECPGNVARMIAKDEDDGQKLRNRSGQYDALTRAYLDVLGIHPAKPNDVPAVLIGPANRDLKEITGAPV